MNHIENGDIVNGDREWERLQEEPADYDEFDETREDEKMDKGDIWATKARKMQKFRQS